MKNRINELINSNPIVHAATNNEETAWLNVNIKPFKSYCDDLSLNTSDIEDASARIKRFASYIRLAFPETEKDDGVIESPLREITKMKECLNQSNPDQLKGKLLLKLDSHLAIAGSIKARGGIYEILKYAETLAIQNGLLSIQDDYGKLIDPEFKSLFEKYTIQVGSTGNLGMSIGIISAKLGFKVIVHMSSDAKEWKKNLLRKNGVNVIEYESDYGTAVEEGRKNSLLDPMSYFVDDEQSKDLFLGYSVAGERLREQLDSMKITVDEKHPMFVYLPCGIGGAPGGVTFGLKETFGDNVHCFFVEPTQACCMLLGVATGLHSKISVQDFGISGKTHADGLAVSRPSAFVGPFIQPMLSGILTIDDARLFDYMRKLLDTEQIFIEPSACSAFAFDIHSKALNEYIEQNGLTSVESEITHIAWATGGSMVPQSERDIYLHTHLDLYHQ